MLLNICNFIENYKRGSQDLKKGHEKEYKKEIRKFLRRKGWKCCWNERKDVGEREGEGEGDTYIEEE